VFKQLTIRLFVGDQPWPHGGPLRRAARWGLHLDKMITERLPLGEIGNAYAIAMRRSPARCALYPTDDAGRAVPCYGRLPGVVPEEGDLEFAIVLSTGSEREL